MSGTADNLQPNGKRGEFVAKYKNILTGLLEIDKDIFRLEHDDVHEARKRVKSKIRETIEELKMLSAEL